MLRMLSRSARPCFWIVTSGLVGIVGCGGGGEPAPAPAAKTETAKAETAKEGAPTVKGLGGKAKERQGEMDSQAPGAAAPGAAAPGAAAQPADPQAEARKAMMQAQGGPPGGRPSDSPGPASTAPGAAAPGAAAPAGGYVPGYAQGGSQGGSQGGPGGGPPPGVGFGAAPGPGGQAAGMMPPGGYGAPGVGMQGGIASGGGGTVLLAETAFLEGGEALTGRTDGQPGGQFGGQGPAGEAGQGGFGGEKVVNDFSDPAKAVESFLSAVKARDGERIGQAISRRAPGEAKGAGLKRVMTNAVEKKLTDEEVANIAETFADYEILNINPGRTSGSVNVTIGRERKGEGKADRYSYERRIMRVHRDGNTGFKILDFGNRIVND